MRIVFFGSDDFAATHLEYLIKSNYAPVACVTQPDSRQGRGMKLTLSPIKVVAGQHGIDCLQPDTLKNPSIVQQLKEYNADLFVVVAYGKLLTQDILNLPKIFCINVHGSLLPKYRGAAPINWAILNGDAETGVTIQKMALALDAGDVIAQSKMPIAPDMTADVLRARMAQEGAQLLIKTIQSIEHEKYSLTPQDEQEVTYASKLIKDMGCIDWHDDAQTIYNQIRGLKPWPGAFTFYNGKMLKILQAQAIEGNGKSGQVISVDKQSFIVACKQGALKIIEVQPEASKAMSASAFIAGYKITTQTLLE